MNATSKKNMINFKSLHFRFYIKKIGFKLNNPIVKPFSLYFLNY